MARALGLDLGGTALKWALLEDGQRIGHGARPTPRHGADHVVAAMAEVASELGDVASVGVGVPGLYEPDGSTTLLPNVPGQWAGFPLAARLTRRIDLPVGVCNDARAFTLAELRLGAGRGCRDLVALTLGTGVGGGVASRGRIHLGGRERAGEVGHQVVDDRGALCGCGARGCLETVASGPAIVAAAARVVWQGCASELRGACADDPSRLDVETVAAVARDGDAFAVAIVERAGTAIGVALANACTILAPERIVIGGGVSAALDLLRPAIEATIGERARLPDPPPVVAAELGTHAGAVGAALWGAESEQDE